MRKILLFNPSTEKTRLFPSKNPSELDLQFISDLRSFEDLQSFLESETRHRKENKKSAITRRLSQDSWKGLKKNLLLSFNKKLPNKSIKLCRKMLKDSLSWCLLKLFYPKFPYRFTQRPKGSLSWCLTYLFNPHNICVNLLSCQRLYSFLRNYKIYR